MSTEQRTRPPYFLFAAISVGAVAAATLLAAYLRAQFGLNSWTTVAANFIALFTVGATLLAARPRSWRKIAVFSLSATVAAELASALGVIAASSIWLLLGGFEYVHAALASAVMLTLLALLWPIWRWLSP